MNCVKTFTVGIDPVSESNVFTSGDTITGQVTLELSSDCKIDSLHVKLKGKAKVKWTEHYGKTSVTYHNKEKYFSMTQPLLKDVHNNTVGPGFNSYPFTFKIPSQELPSSFKGSCGKIVYSVEAILSRPMRLDSKAKAEFTVLHRGSTGSETSPAVVHGMIEKKMNLFTSGTVGMDVKIDQTRYQRGGHIKVVASVHNRSSRDVRPKYCLYRKNSYFAKNKRKVQTKDILKEVGEIIPPSAGQTVTRIITIPSEVGVSILNCGIIKAEYRLRVYLDVKYAMDPQIKFPIVVLPTPEGATAGEEQEYGFDKFARSDFTAGFSLPENPTAPEPSAPPPPYTSLYPSLSGTGGKH